MLCLLLRSAVLEELMARGPYAEATPHYRLDEPPALLEAKTSADGRSPPLTQASRGGGQLEDASRAYTFRNGRRLCLGVRAVGYGAARPPPNFVASEDRRIDREFELGRWSWPSWP